MDDQWVRTVVAEVEPHRMAAEAVVVDVPAALAVVAVADMPQPLPPAEAVVEVTDAARVSNLKCAQATPSIPGRRFFFRGRCFARQSMHRNR